jgi:cytochrome P460
MKSTHRIAATIGALILSAGTAMAQQACTTDVTDPFDLTEAQVDELYACIKDKMAEGYAKGGNEIAMNYRNWAVTSTRPAVTGPHGNRLLQTFANDVAAAQYLKFEEEGVQMPVGSVLAKESAKLNKKKGAVVVGPLFIMTKGEAGSAPDANDWIYSGVTPSGKPMKFKQAFCADCHALWPGQDNLGYPAEEVRVSN